MRKSENMKSSRRPRTALLLAALFLLVAALLGFVRQGLAVTAYSLETKVTGPIRIVLLTDLHNAEFGENNEKLAALVEKQGPDLIFLGGDMLNRDDPHIGTVLTLIENLTPIAPVYYGYGNHEYSWERTFGQDLRQNLEKAGAVVVDNGYVDVEVNGQELRIGGYMGYYRQPGMLFESMEQWEKEILFMLDFEDTNRLKLLINHIPTAWLDWEYIDRFPVDIVFSGHYHGGVIRIPVLEQGLIAPYVGWFPPYTKGVFTGETATCVLSAGLGVEHHVPRWNNPPEVVVVDLVPEKQPS